MVEPRCLKPSACWDEGPSAKFLTGVRKGRLCVSVFSPLKLQTLSVCVGEPVQNLGARSTCWHTAAQLRARGSLVLLQLKHLVYWSETATHGLPLGPFLTEPGRGMFSLTGGLWGGPVYALVRLDRPSVWPVAPLSLQEQTSFEFIEAWCCWRSCDCAFRPTECMPAN